VSGGYGGGRRRLPACSEALRDGAGAEWGVYIRIGASVVVGMLGKADTLRTGKMMRGASGRGQNRGVAHKMREPGRAPEWRRRAVSASLDGEGARIGIGAARFAGAAMHVEGDEINSASASVSRQRPCTLLVRD
jgi:hypothetical protein